MLLEHFNLGVQPFGVTPDARFLYLSQTHREAIASLIYGIRSGRGFTALIAAPGMGKTTLLFHLLGQVKGIAKTAFLFQTLCGPEQFLRSLLVDLGLEDGGDVARMHAKLNSYLLQESRLGRQVIVVIDEAQNLDDGVFELVRMLSNFETPGKKLMQIVLSGQPQLAEKLASERFTQLRQRISMVARLAPFNGQETREYIEHRLRVAGSSVEKPLFSKQAYTMIAEQACGIPRNINNLCFNSMSLACALKRAEVDASIVQETINDLDLATIASSKRPEAQQCPSTRPSGPRALRKYAEALAIGFLIFIGLSVGRWVSSDGRILPERATSLSRQRTNGDDSEVGPASKVLVRDQGEEQIQHTQEKLPTNAESARPALHAIGTISASHFRKSHIRARPSQQSTGTRMNTHANDQTAADTPELGSLPKDLERLQHLRMVDWSPNSQVPEQNRVPFAPAPQREKP